MIYAIGDSHAGIFAGFSLPVRVFQESTTMYNFAKSNKFPEQDFTERDIVLFVHGEIDIRCRIHQQVQAGRSADTVISELVRNYVDYIKEQTAARGNPFVAICLPVPPVYKCGPDNPSFPRVGTFIQLIEYHKSLCKELISYARESGIAIFDFLRIISRPCGDFNPHLLDRWFCHVNEKFAGIIENAFLWFLEENNLLSHNKFDTVINYQTGDHLVINPNYTP